MAATALLDMPTFSQAVRRIVVEQSRRADVGHIGSALSIADMVTALYCGVLRDQDPADADRDRFVLSKGHGALALYAALHLRGQIDTDLLGTYCADGTLLSTHPHHELAGIDFSTGSLGHGLSIAAGAALAARFQHSARRAWVLISDAECNEGSTWEAAMFAAHHELGNLVALIDVNGQQALGKTADVLDLEPLADRWAAFGWHVHEVDGHNPQAIADLLERARAGDQAHSTRRPPQVIICRTTFGHGVSYMRNQVAWHYLPMTEQQYQVALQEIDGA